MFAHRKNVALRLRYLERMPLWTSFPDVVERAAAVTRSAVVDGGCELVVDATGVGAPVVDMLRRARLMSHMSAVKITGGWRESQSHGYYHVPKRDLITGLQLALQGGVLQIAAGLPHRETLMEEMAAMQVRVTAAGNEQFGAWREKENDDMVLAVSMSCWGARKAYPRDLNGQAGYWDWAVG